MPRRVLNSARSKKSKMKVKLSNKSSININIGRPLGIAVRRNVMSAVKPKGPFHSGPQLLSRPSLHFGNPESRYIQAIPNHSVISYNPIQSSLSNSAPVGQRLGISALTVQPGNPAGIKVDNTPSKRLVQERPADYLLKPISSTSGFGSIFGENARGVANDNDEETSMLNQAPMSYTSILGHPRSNGSYLQAENPSSNLVRPSGNVSSSYSVPQSLSTGPASLGNLKPFVLKPYSDDGKQESVGLRNSSSNRSSPESVGLRNSSPESVGLRNLSPESVGSEEPYRGRLTRLKDDAPGFRGYGRGYKRGGTIGSF
jgi:hypothetical protein